MRDSKVLNPVKHLLDVVEWETVTHVCAADKSAVTPSCYHVNTDQNPRVIFSTSLNLPYETAVLMTTVGPTQY